MATLDHKKIDPQAQPRGGRKPSDMSGAMLSGISTNVVEYSAIAATSWVVDTGASYDVVPQSLTKQEKLVRRPLRDAIVMQTAKWGNSVDTCSNNGDPWYAGIYIRRRV